MASFLYLQPYTNKLEKITGLIGPIGPMPILQAFLYRLIGPSIGPNWTLNWTKPQPNYVECPNAPNAPNALILQCGHQSSLS
jgi:hypothetical protein